MSLGDPANEHSIEWFSNNALCQVLSFFIRLRKFKRILHKIHKDLMPKNIPTDEISQLFYVVSRDLAKNLSETSVQISLCTLLNANRMLNLRIKYVVHDALITFTRIRFWCGKLQFGIVDTAENSFMKRYTWSSIGLVINDNSIGLLEIMNILNQTVRLRNTTTATFRLALLRSQPSFGNDSFQCLLHVYYMSAKCLIVFNNAQHTYTLLSLGASVSHFMLYNIARTLTFSRAFAHDKQIDNSHTDDFVHIINGVCILGKLIENW